MVAKNTATTHFSLKNECLKGEERKGQKSSDFWRLGSLWCARVCDFEEIEAKIGALEDRYTY